MQYFITEILIYAIRSIAYLEKVWHGLGGGRHPHGGARNGGISVK